MNYLARLFGMLLPVVLSACATSVKGIDASDEELLTTLASLAKRGTETICNPVILEKELGIKIGALVVNRPGPQRGDYIFDQEAKELRPVRDTGQIKTGGYVRFRSPTASFCHVNIQFSTQRLCKLNTPQVASAMGVSLTIGPVAPHGPQYGAVEFVYNGGGKRTVVGLGTEGKFCANGFNISSEGEWK